jgi:GTP-binding protein
MKPVMALVGRPNVGKSTLFNRLTKSRDAIVADFAGLTRDRHYGNGRQGKHEYIVIDTGGFEPDGRERHLQGDGQADPPGRGRGRCGGVCGRRPRRLSAQDHDIAKYLRRLGKPCVLVANKAEGMTDGTQLAEFLRAGPGRGAPRLGGARPGHPQPGGPGAGAAEPARPRGRRSRSDRARRHQAGRGGAPNVGKSTLINTWLGEERLVALTMPGTTRDAIACRSSAMARSFELIDTAGLRRKGKVFEAIEKFSVVKTCRPSSRPMSCCCCWTPPRA